MYLIYNNNNIYSTLTTKVAVQENIVRFYKLREIWAKLF